MKITDITPQKRNERVNIYIDGKFAFGLDEELRYKYDLFVDKEVTKEFIDDVLKAEEQNKVIFSALNILSYSQRSEKEVYTKLMRKGYEEEHVLKAIEYCKERNYINDRLFAESFIKDKTNLNKYGSVRIRYDLIAKGIDKEIIDEVLELDFDDEYSRAYELASKKIKSYRNDDRNAIYRKLGGFLQRKGYSYDVVMKVLREVLEES
ncbi:MAG: RecX family transcriptional regulator [Tissierellaceae bacterium]|nr:RecX family transcriptional regulator [Tissierellaceae bacterium]